MAINIIMGESGKSQRGLDIARYPLDYLESDNPRLSKKQITALIRDRKLRDQTELYQQEDIERHGKSGVRRRRAVPPLILNLDVRERIRREINSSPHQHKYISGALCFSENEESVIANRPELVVELMERFEAFIFAGINPEDKLIYWVEHTDKGRLEINYVIPQICPSTRYHWNPLPPGAQYDFNLIQDHFNLEFGLDSPDDKRYLNKGRKKEFLPQKSKFFLPIPPYESRSGIRNQAVDYLYGKIQSFEIECVEDVYITISSDAFTEATGLRLETGQRRSFGSSTHGAYVTLLTADNKRIRLKGFAFSDRFTSETLFTSRVQDARFDRATTTRVLREMKWEIRNMLLQRAYTQRKRCYPKAKTTAPTFRYRYRETIAEEPIKAETISTMLNNMFAAVMDPPIVIPKFTDNMSQADLEQAYLELLSALAILERRAIERGVKQYQAMIEALYYHLTQDYHHVHNKSNCALSSLIPPADRYARSANQENGNYVDDAIQRCADRFKQIGQRLQRGSDVIRWIEGSSAARIVGESERLAEQPSENRQGYSSNDLLQNRQRKTTRIDGSSCELADAVRQIESNFHKVEGLVSGYQRLVNKGRQSRVSNEPK